MTTMDIKYHLVPPSSHRTNNAERKIHTFKNKFIAGLCILDAYFQLQLWYRMIQQATISINITRQSRLHPHLLSYTHIYGQFDYNLAPLSPPGKKLGIHYRKRIERPGQHIGNSDGTLYQPCNTTYSIRHTSLKQERKLSPTQYSSSPETLSRQICHIKMLPFTPHNI